MKANSAPEWVFEDKTADFKARQWQATVQVLPSLPGLPISLFSADTSHPQVFQVLRARNFLSSFYINHLETFIECGTVSQELGREGLMKHNPDPCEVSRWVLF